MARVFEVAVYKHYYTDHSYDELPPGVHGRMHRQVNWMERHLRCFFCKNTFSDNLVTGRKITTPLSESKDESGLQNNDYLTLCSSCGFWFARGTRGINEGVHMGRVCWPYIKRLETDLDSLDVSVNSLIKHISKNQDDLLKIHPVKAEELVTHLFKDYFDCEVRHVGGTGDGGVDAIVIKGDKIETIIQVKWRRDNRSGEGVKLIRELSGTMIARGVPSAILVTTRNHLTKGALEEIHNISKTPLTRESLNLDYRTYSDILSMLEISRVKLSEKMTISENVKEDERRILLFDFLTSMAHLK